MLSKKRHILVDEYPNVYIIRILEMSMKDTTRYLQQTQCTRRLTVAVTNIFKKLASLLVSLVRTLITSGASEEANN